MVIWNTLIWVVDGLFWLLKGWSANIHAQGASLRKKKETDKGLEAEDTIWTIGSGY